MRLLPFARQINSSGRVRYGTIWYARKRCHGFGAPAGHMHPVYPLCAHCPRCPRNRIHSENWNDWKFSMGYKCISADRNPKTKLDTLHVFDYYVRCVSIDDPITIAAHEPHTHLSGLRCSSARERRNSWFENSNLLKSEHTKTIFQYDLFKWATSTWVHVGWWCR